MPPRNRECVLLLDENMSSPIIVGPLRDLAGWTIKAHGDCFEPGTKDEEIVELCGKNEWALVTLDEMRYTPETTAVIERHRVRVFKLITHEKTHFIILAGALIQAQKAIIALMRKDRSGFCAHIHQNGSVKIMTRFDDAFAGALSGSRQRTIRKFGRL